MEFEERHYFVCANTAMGFIDHFSSNLAGLNRIFILKGGSGTGKSTMMKRIGEAYQKCDYQVDYIHCSSDPNSLDGVIIPDLSVAIVDGTAPHVVEPLLPGAIEDYVNLGLALDRKKLEPYKSELLGYKQAIKEQYRIVYQCLQEVGELKRKMQSLLPPQKNILTPAMAKEVTNQVLGEQVLMKKAAAYHRFYGALTTTGERYLGLQDFAIVDKRFVLTGQAVAEIMQHLQATAVKRGYTVEIYHDHLLPENIQVIYLPELKTCILDGQVEALQVVCQPKDVRYDFDQALPDEHSAEQKSELAQLQQDLTSAQKRAMDALKMARKNHDDLERRYYPAVDFTIVEQIHDAISAEIAVIG